MALKSLVNASAETLTDAPDEVLAAALEVADELDELDDDELLPQAAIPMRDGSGGVLALQQAHMCDSSS
jgi:hypothetical protein